MYIFIILVSNIHAYLRSATCVCTGDESYGGKCGKWDAEDEAAWCRVITPNACGADATFLATGYFWSRVPCSAHGAAVLPYRDHIVDKIATAPTIHVFLTNYYNLQWTKLNVNRLTRLARYRHTYTVLSMEDTDKDFMKSMHAFPPYVRVEHFRPPRGLIGGSVLTSVMKHIGQATTGSITLIADSDAVVMSKYWDERVLDVYSDADCVLAAINPRPGFTGIAEWNWMTFRTSFYRPRMDHVEAACIDGQGCEHGHWFTLQALHAHKRQFLWGDARAVLSNKSPVVVLDRGAPWVLHCFYSTRTRNEAASLSSGGELSDEGKVVMSYAEEQELMNRVKHNTVRMQQGECYSGVFSVGKQGGRCVKWNPEDKAWTTNGCNNHGNQCMCTPVQCVHRAEGA